MKPIQKTRPIAWVLLLLLCGVIGWFGWPVILDGWLAIENAMTGAQVKKDTLELEVKKWLNEKVEDSKHRCVFVKLIKEDRSHFVGYAEMDDGDTIDVKVTTDGNEFLIQTQIPLKYTGEWSRFNSGLWP